MTNLGVLQKYPTQNSKAMVSGHATLAGGEAAKTSSSRASDDPLLGSHTAA